MTPGWGILLLSGVLVAASIAQAQTRDPVREAQEHVDRGDRHFDEREFELAIAEYTAALAVAPHPDLVWNIGRAHEEMKRYSQAIAFFERYALMAVSDEDRAVAGQRVSSLRERLATLEVGQLVVNTPSSAARIVVGGAPVGSGERLVLDLKPGRYRVRVELAGHKDFETLVRVEPAGVAEVQAVLERSVPLGSLVVRTGVVGALVSVDGGEPVPAGAPLAVAEGAHKIRVTAADRLPYETLVEVRGGSTTTLDVELERKPPPEEFSDWIDTFRVFGSGSEQPVSERFAGGLLTLSSADPIAGTIAVPRRVPLRQWQRGNCGGADAVTWTGIYRATLELDGLDARLKLTDGQLTDCSCATYCKQEPEGEATLIALPGREGLVGDDLVILRSRVAERASAAYLDAGAGPAPLKGGWQVVAWGGSERASSERLTVDEGLEGALRRVRSGMVPSFERAACPGEPRFTQIVEYPVRLRPTGSAWTLEVKPGREVSCSCGGACGRPPSLRSESLRLLAFPRYLVGGGVVLRRETR